MRTTFPGMCVPLVWWTIDYLGDAVLLIDIFWRFYVGYYALGVVVTTRRLVVRNYLHGSFLLDLVASLPFDFALYDCQEHAFLRLNRLLRLYHVPNIFRSWEQSTSRPVVFRLTKLFCGIMMLAHWTACAFFAVVKQEDKRFGADGWPQPVGTGWPQGMQEELESPAHQAYARALFWCITLLTGMGPDHNKPDTNMELAFSFLMLFIGIFVFASVIGNVGDLISNRNATSAKFRKKLDIVNLWMRYKGINPILQQRIRNYYQYIWQRQAGLNDAIILSDLPLHLRADVSSDLNKDILRKVSLFEKCGDESFLQELTRKLKPEVYTPNDFIIREGDFGASMYFITRGIVTVELDDVGKVNTLGEGSFFGEVALLMKAKRNASIVAKTFVDVFVLSKADVDEALLDYPEYAMEIYRMANDLGTQDQNKDVRAAYVATNKDFDHPDDQGGHPHDPRNALAYAHLPPRPGNMTAARRNAAAASSLIVPRSATATTMPLAMFFRSLENLSGQEATIASMTLPDLDHTYEQLMSLVAKVMSSRQFLLQSLDSGSPMSSPGAAPFSSFVRMSSPPTTTMTAASPRGNGPDAHSSSTTSLMSSAGGGVGDPRGGAGAGRRGSGFVRKRPSGKRLISSTKRERSPGQGSRGSTRTVTLDPYDDMMDGSISGESNISMQDLGSGANLARRGSRSGSRSSLAGRRGRRVAPAPRGGGGGGGGGGGAGGGKIKANGRGGTTTTISLA